MLLPRASVNHRLPSGFYQREWVPMLRRLGIRPRPFYNARHTYISFMISA